MEKLTVRASNRALLARQLLLRRADLPVTDALRHLAGLQAQAPQAPYVGLWSRVAGFTPDQLSDLIAGRRAVRAVLMRATIHLVTAEDCLAWWPLVVPVLERNVYGNTTYGQHRLEGLDMAAVLAAGRRLVEERPRTATQLRDEMAGRWPEREPAALAYAVRQLLPLVHVPPRGLWRGVGQPVFTTVESWLGRGVAAEPSVDRMVLRYLAAFGPASVADMQTWSGLTRLREVIDPLRDRLSVFRDENGKELLDLPDAPRPDPDTPAPVRFLPEFDNLWLSHADRTRVMPDKEHLRRAYNRGMVLLDGFTQAAWKFVRQKKTVTVEIEPFAPLPTREAETVTEEAARLLEFAAPDEEHDIRFA